MRDFVSIIRRKQRCRRLVYFLILMGFLVCGLFLIGQDIRTVEGESYKNRNLLSTSQVNDTISGQEAVNTTSKNDSGNETDCSIPSIAEFPNDLFTQAQRKKGAALVHVIVGMYMCIALGIVCDYYFVPSLEVLCYKLKIQSDVAGASLMAIGSSAPELCASVIGVFVTKGDIGIGTILGSAVFNLLFVIGICGVFATCDLKLSWWPITRDTIAYGVTIVVLAVVIFDSSVYWVEAVIMLVLYLLYLVFMSQNQRIEKSFYLLTGDTKSFKQRFEKAKDETTPLTPNEIKGGDLNDDDRTAKDDSVKITTSDLENKAITSSDSEEEEDGWPDEAPDNIIAYPESIWDKVSWIFVFPMKVVFFLTIPDLRRPSCRGFVFVTFFMSICWIGFLTYTLVWMVTVVGFTIDIPDSVMGLTFVTFGSSVPDALASIIVAKQGKGNMAVSQALGSNVFDILLGLGLPWTIKSFMRDSKIKIQSMGMLISCFVTFVLNILVLLILYLKKFSLGKRIGLGLIIAYVIYLAASVTIELFLYKDYRLPPCDLGANW